MQVAIQEARRLQRFGVTQAEADTYRQATLRDNFMASMQADYVPAQEILEFLMETLATRGVFSDNQQVQARSLSVCVRYQHLHLLSCSWPCLLTTLAANTLVPSPSRLAESSWQARYAGRQGLGMQDILAPLLVGCIWSPLSFMSTPGMTGH